MTAVGRLVGETTLCLSASNGQWGYCGYNGLQSSLQGQLVERLSTSPPGVLVSGTILADSKDLCTTNMCEVCVGLDPPLLRL